MSVHSLSSKRTADAADPVREAKIHLAAAHRLAVFHELEEGIDNHFTVTVPGHDDRYLILPFGLHWSEARASDMIIWDESGKTLEGEGLCELSAQCIHAPIHRITGARVVLHTHQTWAVALNMLKNNRLLPASQTAAFFHGHIAYDDTYAGTADTLEEGERLAKLIGGKRVLFMKNHGVLVVGDTVAQAYGASTSWSASAARRCWRWAPGSRWKCCPRPSSNRCRPTRWTTAIRARTASACTSKR